ncbi:MAG: theronine dehydrogenase, partial [Lentisphaerae bacterium]
MTASVKAIVLEDVRKVDWRDVELATVEAMDARVKTLRSAISVGTERWAYQGKRREIRFPSVLGYMGIGRVVEAGAEAMSQGIK